MYQAIHVISTAPIYLSIYLSNYLSISLSIGTSSVALIIVWCFMGGWLFCWLISVPRWFSEFPNGLPEVPKGLPEVPRGLQEGPNGVQEVPLEGPEGSRCRTDFNETSFWCFVASPYHAFCAPVRHFANVCFYEEAHCRCTVWLTKMHPKLPSIPSAIIDKNWY